jgi:hypothetical protein
MEDGIFPWSDLMAQLSWFKSLNNQFTKPLSPSLGVNRMWTKRSDHAPKSECADFIQYMVKKGSFENKLEFDHSFVFSYLHLLFRKKIIKNHYNNISLP